MSLKIGWRKGFRNGTYPLQIKGAAVGAAGGRLMVAGGMYAPGGALRSGYWLPIEEREEGFPSMVLPGRRVGRKICANWYPMPALPLCHGWTSGTAVAGGLAVVGGRPSNVVTATVHFLDATKDEPKWERLPDRPSPCMVATTISDGDMLYTAFGSVWQPHEHGNEDTNIYRINVRERNDNMASGWEIVTRFPGAPRWMGGMAICNEKLYVIGGRDWPLEGLDIKPHNAYNVERGLMAYREMWEYDFDTDKWTELPRPPRAFVSDIFTVADRWIVVPGGRSWVVYPEGVSTRFESYVADLDLVCYSREVFAYDTYTGDWSLLEPLPYGTCSHRMSVWKNIVYIVGNEVLDKKRGNTYGTVFEGHIETNFVEES